MSAGRRFTTRAPNPLLAREERYLLPLLANLSRQALLDLACGTGRWLEKLLSQGAIRESGLIVRSQCCESPVQSKEFEIALQEQAARAFLSVRPLSIWQSAHLLWVISKTWQPWRASWRASRRRSRCLCQRPSSGGIHAWLASGLPRPRRRESDRDDPPPGQRD